MPVGQIISGRYEIFRKLGRGGMGDVFAANDLQLERKVALKAIRAEFRLQAASRARFLREARALSRLEHPSICRIHDYVAGEDQDYYYEITAQDGITGKSYPADPELVVHKQTKPPGQRAPQPRAPLTPDA